jgi:hypothetical protein
MRLLVFLVAGLAAQAQSDPLREALAPVEQWLGAPLVIYGDAAPIASPEPGEAAVADGMIYVSLSRLRAFRSPVEVAAFLSHAAAHRKLNHAAVFDEKARLYAQAVILSPHFPRATMEANMRAGLEKEAEPVAAEFLAKSGCTASSCELFERLLKAVPR